MANLFQKKDRHIIPNWRSYKNTAELGELNGSQGIKLDSSFRPDISDLLEDWNIEQNIGIAGDIIGAALVSNQEDNLKVREISQFVMANPNLASKAILNAANQVFYKKGEIINFEPDLSDGIVNEELQGKYQLYKRIKELKIKLSANPRNAISWVEISRIYSILGQDYKARRAIMNGYNLAPENRFILRSIARFLVHIGDLELAHDIIRKSELTKSDPWLLATEISIASLRQRYSKFIKSGSQILSSGNFHPFNTTELAGTLATLEFQHDNVKKSKKLFEISLIKPNDNSLAQAEWASQEERDLITVDPKKFNLINSFEAIARDFNNKGNWEEALKYAKKWFYDLPLSKNAVLFGNELAFSKLKDHNRAVEFAKLGLLSHPNDAHLLNNIIYSLCLINKTQDAFSYLNKVKKDDLNSNSDTGICLTATRGLYYFRTNEPELGRQFYQDAIQMARTQDKHDLNNAALVNYIREEILLGELDVEPLIHDLEKIAKHYNDDLGEDAMEVLNLYHEYRQS